MPKDALADILGDWEQLLAALDEFLARHPDAFLRQKRDEIAAMLAYTKLLADEQLSLATRHRVITKELRIAKSRGRDLAIQARALLKGHLGHRSVALRRFNVRPIRRRSRAMPETSDLGALTFALGAEREKLALLPMEIRGLPLALPEASTSEAEAASGPDGAAVPTTEASNPMAETPGSSAEAPVSMGDMSAGSVVSPADS